MRSTTLTHFCRIAIVLGLCSSVSAQNHSLSKPERGTCTIRWTEDGRFDIWANEAPIDGVLRDLGRLHGAEIRVVVSPENMQTFRYLDVDLIDTMDRLGVDYSLNYIRNERGDAVLSGGTVGHGAEGQAPKHPWLPLPTGPKAEEVKDLISRLRDDDVRWNFEDAISVLFAYEPVSIAIPFLEQALAQGDWQQRGGAFQILRGYAQGWSGKKEYMEPSQLFLEVTAKGMTDDQIIREDERKFRPSHSATFGLNYFVSNPEHVQTVESTLSQALYQQDRQFRFLSATLLGGAGRTSNAGRLVEILAPQLMDNETERDSTLAIYGLSGLGPSAASYLNQFEFTADEQARGFLEKIRANWNDSNWRTNYPYLRTTYWDQADFNGLPGDARVKE